MCLHLINTDVAIDLTETTDDEEETTERSPDPTATLYPTSVDPHYETNYMKPMSSDLVVLSLG